MTIRLNVNISSVLETAIPLIKSDYGLFLKTPRSALTKH